MIVNVKIPRAQLIELVESAFIQGDAHITTIPAGARVLKCETDSEGNLLLDYETHDTDLICTISINNN